MSRKWFVIIIITIVTLFLWTIWQAYSVFRAEKEVDRFSRYTSPIEREFDTKLVEDLATLQNRVLVTEEDITPQ